LFFLDQWKKSLDDADVSKEVELKKVMDRLVRRKFERRDDAIARIVDHAHKRVFVRFGPRLDRRVRARYGILREDVHDQRADATEIAYGELYLALFDLCPELIELGGVFDRGIHNVPFSCKVDGCREANACQILIWKEKMV